MAPTLRLDAARTARAARWAVAGFLMMCLIASVWIGVRGALAAFHLNEVRTTASSIADAFTQDEAEATSELRVISEHTEEAHTLTSDPVWLIAEHAPWIGPQLRAVREITSSTDHVIRQGILPLAESLQKGTVDALKPVEGRIDTTSLSQITGPASEASDRAHEALASIQQIDRTPLVGRLADLTDQVEDLLGRSSAALDSLSRASELLPGMLGNSGPRSYLVLVQNNAELRSLGGIAGTALLMQTEGGRVTLAATESGTALSAGITDPIVELPEDVQSIYGTRPARFFQNLTQVPDFSFDGPLAREMYRQQTGRDVDGVIAIDPVVLSYLLGATGTVSLPDGSTITAQNVTSLFLSEVYQRYPDPAAQDAFFAASSASIFDAFIQGRGSSLGILSALGRAADERRISVWSAVAEEQDILMGSSVAGELPSTDDRTARFGVFLNDGGGSKMSYYVKPDVSLAWNACGSPTSQTPRQLTLTVGLSNAAPADAATALPLYVTANGWFGVAPGTAAIVGNIYLPEGYMLVSAQTSNGASLTPSSLQGREVLSYGLELAPQASETVTVSVETASSARSAEAVVTPTADSSIDPVVRTTCETSGTATLQ